MEYLLTAAEDGVRVDQFVAGETELSRSAVQQLCEAGTVLVDGRPAVKNRRLKRGEEVRVMVPEPEPLEAGPENIPVEIVYEDESLLVVNKPKGMVVHPAPGNESGTLVNALLYRCAGRLSSVNGVIRPGIVHRIDKDTSGLLVVAKTDAAHLSLAAQIQAHSLDRFYLAVVYGGFGDDSGRVEAPIGRHPADRKKMCVQMQPGRDARDAATNYIVLERFRGFSYLKLQLETGRTHQIRVHMAHIGHPVAGDPLYGPSKILTELKGQCLHAAAIGFDHPLTGERLRFEVEPPAVFLKFLDKLRRESGI